MNFMRISLPALVTVILFSVTGVSCSAQEATTRELRIEDELRVMQVSYPNADIEFWQGMVGQEMLPGLVLESVKILQDCGDHVHSIFTLKPPAALPAQEQPKAEPQPQRGKPRLQERNSSAFA